jgi:predicted ATP-dependent endonuclease of OLD family
MIVKKVEVKNFRSLKESNLSCDNLVAILGRNGSGKSSFLHALDIFYDVAARISEEDFFNRDITIPIEIRITYGDLRADEKEKFHIFISKIDLLIITKRISVENERIVQSYYAAVSQIPEFAEIRALPGKAERRTAWNKLIDEPGDLINLGTKAKSSDEVDHLMSEYENTHTELTKPIEKEQQFFGPRNIGGGMLDNFTKFVLVPAVRDVADEVTGRKGAIYQILDMIVLRKINARSDIQEFKAEFDGKARKLYSSANLPELPELGNSISETLAKFAPGSRLKLDWDEFDLPEIQAPAAKATLLEDNFEGEISRKGHGLQRALILTLLQHLAMTVHIEVPSEQTTEEFDDLTLEGGEELPLAVPNSKPVKVEAVTLAAQELESPASPDLILAIEEPELYLHPSRCRYMHDVLVQLATKPEEKLSPRNQIIYTTHSPYLVDMADFDQIRVVRKQPSTECAIPHTSVTQYAFTTLCGELAQICNVDPDSFRKESTRARARSVMNTIVNEGFFSDVVVVVEGLSEVGILWKLQDILNKNWSKLGIAIIPAGGKNNLDRPIVIFRGFSIPTYFIFDADSQYKGKGKKEGEDDAKKRNRKYLRLAGATEEDFPSTKVDTTWAVFSCTIDQELEEALNTENFKNIRSKVALELGYTDPERAIKNTDGAMRFIELAYENGHRVPILENIVEKVTLLNK